jgi:vitamin B12 transporter
MNKIGHVRACIFVCLCLSGHKDAVTQTILREDSLKAVTVTADRIRLSGELELLEHIGEDKHRQTPQLFLTDILSRNSHWQILSYGPGMVSTAAHRGNNAEQVRIYWKGVPLNHPALGMFDLSTVPAVLFSQVSLMHTGSSAQMGNGSLGGSVFLNNRPVENGVRLQNHTSTGSFGFVQQMTGAEYAHKKWSGSTKVLWMRSNNDYTYRPLHGEERPLPNADYYQKHFLQDIRYEINDRTNIEAALWLMEKHNNIPPTTTASAGQRASLEDNNVYTTLSLNHMISENSGLLVQYAYAHADQYFTQEFPEINSYNPVRTHYAEQHYYGKRGDFTFKAGQQFTYSEAPGPNLSEDNFQRFYSLFGQAGYYGFSRWNTQLSLRQEWVNGFDPPLSFAWKNNFKVRKRQALWLRFSRNYRVPTLNHLYWSPVGNPDLLPEDNILGETGWTLKRKYLTAGITLYASETENYIQWRPSIGQFWAADNVKRVRAFGAELSADGKWPVTAKHLLGFSVRLSAGRAEGISEDDPHRGKQLIYQPIYRTASSLFYKYDQWTVSLHGRYISEMYALPGHDPSVQIPDVLIVSNGISRRVAFKKTTLDASLFLENIANTRYELQLGRPMPGFHFLFSVNISLNPNS